MSDFAAGWFGGVCGVLVSHPLDTLRTQQAVTGQSWRQALQAASGKGVMCLYHGVLSPCTSVGVWKAVTLGVHNEIQRHLRRLRRLDDCAAGAASGSRAPVPLPMVDVTASACAAGSIGAAVCTPFELIKSLAMLQDRAERGGISARLPAPSHAPMLASAAATESGGKGGIESSARLPHTSKGVLSRLVAEELLQLKGVIARPGGARNLLRGVHILLLRDCYATGVFLGSYEYIRRWAKDCELVSAACSGSSSRGPDMLVSMLAGAISGPLGWVSCYPIEVVRIRWQAAAAGPGRWSSVFQCARHIYSTGGVNAFFRGLPLCCARSSLQISVTMAIFEAARTPL
mmetsp:Transcript_78548/g.230429  ORF Transcript_78548/g.230429 Transcript_78548/m.230429 type:complete len:344 (-) Transcript_78548:170-1201(-)